MIFFDASAVAKRYFYENGSNRVDKLWQGPEPFSSLTVLHCELASVVNRKFRERAINLAAYQSLRERIGRDLRKINALPVDENVIGISLRLLDSHLLKTLDSLYMAGALSLQSAINEPVLCVSADRQLLRAAKAEGLRVLDPEKA